MAGRAISTLALGVVLLVSGTAHADEFRLKDGSKINGTIVGYENDSFRVETAYGFALIRKDKIAEIIPSAPKPPASDKNSEAIIKKEEIKKEAIKKEAEEVRPQPGSPSPSSAPTTYKPAPAVVSEPVSTPKPETPKPVAAKAAPSAPPALPKAPEKTEAVAKKPAPKSDCPAGAICDGGIPNGVKLTAPAVAPVSAAAEPAPIMEIVQGNKYINYTYGFEIYKPPSWDLIAADRKALPNAVAALGTDDGTTLLIIGREVTKNSLDAQATATDKALSGVYENYQDISTRRTMIARQPAVERHSRGSADGHDWSVVTITFLHNGDAFTLLGMTWADSDLIQVQENVLSKVVNSLTFSVQ